MMSSQSLQSPSGHTLPLRGNQLSSSFWCFIGNEKTLCTQVQYGGFIPEEYQEQAFLYVGVIADLIDIKNGANAHWTCRSSYHSFWHKEWPSGQSVGAGGHWVTRDDDGKDLNFGFDSELDFCLACQ